jgi:hypothetical protein
MRSVTEVYRIAHNHIRRIRSDSSVFDTSSVFISVLVLRAEKTSRQTIYIDAFSMRIKQRICRLLSRVSQQRSNLDPRGPSPSPSPCLSCVIKIQITRFGFKMESSFGNEYPRVKIKPLRNRHFERRSDMKQSRKISRGDDQSLPNT